MTDDPTLLDEDFMEQKVPFSTQIPIRLKARMDRYRKYMDRPESQRPEETHDWPSTYIGILDEAVSEWLSRHPLRDKPGPRKAGPKTTGKKAPKRKDDEE